MILELLVSICLVVGATFALIGSIGLARLDDFYSRLHGPTKATTLGVGGMLAGSVIYFSTRGDGPSLHEVLVAAFLCMTAPVSAHLLSKAALHLRVPTVSGVPARGGRDPAVDGGDPVPADERLPR